MTMFPKQLCDLVIQKLDGEKELRDEIKRLKQENQDLKDRIDAKKVDLRPPLQEDIEYINVRKFNLKNIDRNAKMAIIGKPGCGVRTLTKNVIHNLIQKNNLQRGRCIYMGSAYRKADFDQVFGEIFSFAGFNEDFLSHFWRNQQQLVRENVQNQGDRGDEHTLIVIEDPDRNTLRSRTLTDIVYNSRHFNTSLIFILSYPMSISPIFRTHFDTIFLCKENIDRNKRRLYEHYCGMFPTYHYFNQVFDSITEERYNVMVVDNHSHSTNLGDLIFWFKPKVIANEALQLA